MAVALTLADVRRAWDARDPELPRLVARLAAQPDPLPAQPLRDGAVTFDTFRTLGRDYQFRRRPREEQAHQRVELLKALEAPGAEVPLPDRLRLYTVVLDLWAADDPFARSCLFEVIETVPLAYGPWRALKRVFKEAEAKPDTAVYGALAARFDAEAAQHRPGREVSGATLAYLARRAWRFLRRTGVQLPATYPDTAVDLLTRYPADTNWRNTWVANHIFFHDSKKYGRSRFTFGYREYPSPDRIKDRAFGDLWKRSPRPLFTLLERAKADAVRAFAAAGLKADFRAALRDVEPVWVVRLVGVRSAAIDEFVVWLLQNVPTFEQAGFRANGLHAAVLRLLDSPSNAARVYAADYARTHARDLTVPDLVRLANNSHDPVRKLARDLLGERDPRKDVGLAAWGELLDTEHGHAYAAEVIPKAFGAAELTPAWFADRLLTPSEKAFQFVWKLLPKFHAPPALGPAFYFGVLKRFVRDDTDSRRRLHLIAQELTRFDLDTLDRDSLRWLLLAPAGWLVVGAWIDGGKLKPATLGIDFWKALAFHPDYEADPWLAALRASGPEWAAELTFQEVTSGVVLNWMRDVRKFPPLDLGFDWLMKLVARSEPIYHDFAVDTLIRAFAPADFAPQQAAPTAAAPTTVDLQKASFLFTGKLASMTRDEAEAKVKGANGTVAGSVTKNLHYLVIGDEGSPLYGQGKKGSKQVKAEQLNAAGTNIGIISETRFLQMLVGQQVAATADATLAGCERLWELAVAPGPADAPVGKFARLYVRRHHPVIGQQLTDRPVDPGTEVPLAFLTWERVSPLFAETRRSLREFALDLARWEFARWNPDVDALVWMSELPFADVRRFVAQALLAAEATETRAFRLDPAKLEPAAAYRFCEAADPETRALGMELINRVPRFRVPEELFRLTESPDRKVRAFVIRALWAAYRDRGVTAEWKPPTAPTPEVGAKAKKAAAELAATRGDGVPARPPQWPAERPTLAQFLRRVLFEVPPGPPEKTAQDASDDGDTAVSAKKKPEASVVANRPLPARRAKLDLIEVMRDLATEDRAFAAGVLPLLDEFLHSRGASERAACLVAVTRVRHRHPELKAVAP
ncbi:BRCT domain-containing protein [Urbifossiella limnaea]|uniref:DNA polymerase III subunit epsilon n=1 Tax=Urbifossiella limnaea TaxID=2528023 RepID=A0A517XWK7_9BACT|nr:BRCT domain-containing protein [Urbifossiella limnaea]QDU21890.1 DNA polymerase III subunit epsilon [Urbifossiella limnaea]